MATRTHASFHWFAFMGLWFACSALAQPPNILVVMTDDQGYGEFSCHGNPIAQTPHIDRLASESLRLTDFHVAPMCTPTRGQFLTGLDAFRNGAMNVSSGRTLLRPELKTMADLLRTAGYRTGLFGKWHLGDNHPFRLEDRWFEETRWFPSSHINSVPDFWGNDYFDDTYSHNGSTMGPLYYNAGMKGKKTTLWEGGHRVPCFIRWPGGRIGQPRDISELCHVQDLLPTLADLEGVSGLPAQLDGESLAPVFRGERSTLDDRMLVINYGRMPTFKTAYTKGNPAIPQRVIIGSDRENPLLLTACEWLDVFVDQQRQIRAGELKNGVWHLAVGRPGRYVFELRRWPEESGLRLDDAVDAARVTDGMLIAGKKLPIASARLRVGSREFSGEPDVEKRLVRFEADLEKAGPVELQTWFLDASGQPVCGAYYVTVGRVER